MKKYLFLSLATLASIISSCSGSDNKLNFDVQQEATQLNKRLEAAIDTAQVTTREDYDALKVRLDSLETVFYEAYKYKTDSTTDEQAIVTDSVRAVFDKEYRAKINAALDAKQKVLEQEQPQPQEAKKK
ncbi:MAG: hypothetical protein II559_10920 [Muribaculaceae bacterium]|nr:hypothetical protein [Muribaculaceae bacterium]MBQ2563907.1 hypothetical protein [Muribaculaceae bacterium]MBQ5408594.1 hypothetical protein [Muribaculaceae bacterium]